MSRDVIPKGFVKFGWKAAVLGVLSAFINFEASSHSVLVKRPSQTCWLSGVKKSLICLLKEIKIHRGVYS